MKTISIILFAFIMTTGCYAQSKSVVKCSIWKPASFCNIPDSLSLPNWSADSLTIVSVSCEKLNNKSGLVGVWLKLSRKDGSSFMIESDMRNITLVKKNDQKIIQPAAVYWNLGENKGYMSSNVKTNSFKAKFGTQKRIDLIFIFPDAEAGDKIIIKDFIEAVIHE